MNRRRSTNSSSREFDTDFEKIRFVSKYLRLFSDVLAAEFHIVCDNQSCDMKVAFLVNPDDVSEWTVGIGTKSNENRHLDLSWVDDILPTDERWQRHSNAHLYIRPDNGTTIVAYEPEGIILKRVVE